MYLVLLYMVWWAWRVCEGDKTPSVHAWKTVLRGPPRGKEGMGTQSLGSVA
jgi:hypothetical protein